MSKKKLLALLSAVSIVFCSCSLGNKTTFEISSLTDLKALHTSSEQGETFEGKTIVLKDDLYLTDGEKVAEKTIVWKSLFTKGHEFKGTFDGNGKTIICNLKSKENTFTDDGTKRQRGMAYSLLGNIAKEGVVKNLNVLGHFYGDIDSVLVGKNKGIIKNCKLHVIVKDDSTGLGGVCDNNLGIIDDCEVIGRLYANNIVLGGICKTNGSAGETEGGIITNCRVYARLTNDCKNLAKENEDAEDDCYFQTPEIGGIAGFNYAYIGNCEVETQFASINISYDGFEGTAGGIASTNYGIVKNSSYKGDIAVRCAGGIIGNNYGIVESCKAGGTVRGEESGAFAVFNERRSVDTTHPEPLAIIENCEFDGTVKSEKEGVAVLYNRPSKRNPEQKPQVINCKINGEVITREVDAL